MGSAPFVLFFSTHWKGLEYLNRPGILAEPGDLPLTTEPYLTLQSSGEKSTGQKTLMSMGPAGCYWGAEEWNPTKSWHGSEKVAWRVRHIIFVLKTSRLGPACIGWKTV